MGFPTARPPFKNMNLTQEQVNSFGLQPGDMILYYESCPLDWVIVEKTGSAPPVGHVEVYAGNNQSMAARAEGVNCYPLRLDHVVCSRRPKDELNFAAGLRWFNGIAKGQAYDLRGLLCFTALVKAGTPGDMFCSEFATNFYRWSMIELFNPSQPADHVSPRDLWACERLHTFWADAGYE